MTWHCYGLDAAVVQVHVVVCRTACGEGPRALSYTVGLPNWQRVLS